LIGTTITPLALEFVLECAGSAERFAFFSAGLDSSAKWTLRYRGHSAVFQISRHGDAELCANGGGNTADRRKFHRVPDARPGDEDNRVRFFTLNRVNGLLLDVRRGVSVSVP
jgi:hypothetical protein